MTGITKILTQKIWDCLYAFWNISRQEIDSGLINVQEFIDLFWLILCGNISIWESFVKLVNSKFGDCCHDLNAMVMQNYITLSGYTMNINHKDKNRLQFSNQLFTVLKPNYYLLNKTIFESIWSSYKFIIL